MSEREMVELSLEELGAISGGTHKYVTATAEANIRSGPGQEYPVIGKTVIGSDARVIGRKKGKDNLTWFRVSRDGKVGWVCDRYVTKP